MPITITTTVNAPTLTTGVNMQPSTIAITALAIEPRNIGTTLFADTIMELDECDKVICLHNDAIVHNDWYSILQSAWCKVGDKVIFGKYAGKMVENRDTGEEFMVINDDDIQLVIVEE